MHKHRKSTSGKHRKWRNANGCLPTSAVELIANLPREIGTEGTDYFAALYLTSEYLSKYCDERLVSSSDRRSAAITKWKQAEAKNAITNCILRDRDPGYNVLPRVPWSQFLKFARRLTADILGPLRDEVVLGAFSGGASTSRNRTSSHPAEKFCGQADATEDAVQYLDVLARLSPLLRQYNVFTSLREVPGAVLFTVPKKTEIDRCACKEPDVNMFLQKGVGIHIRRRLRRFGVNLNDQSINRSLAATGARDNSLATIDLSSASDTITIEAVKSILPTDWFLYLNDIRSQAVDVDGELIRTEMFSSMGNGFTFELESLLFYVLARTTLYFEGISGIVSVYGDDIIIPSQGYSMVTWALESFGFSVNMDKSFHDGPFRESCGGHYHAHEDVTPFYLRREATHLTDLIRVANSLRRWAFADPARQYMMPATYNVWLKLASYVPEALWGGSDYGKDTQLVSPGCANKQLIRLSADRKVPDLGAYIHWQNSNWNRTVDPDESGYPPSDVRKLCRMKKVRFGAQSETPKFHQELG